MKTYKIAAIPGDGIGTEVIDAGVEVLKALATRDGTFDFHFEVVEDIAQMKQMILEEVQRFRQFVRQQPLHMMGHNVAPQTSNIPIPEGYHGRPDDPKPQEAANHLGGLEGDLVGMDGLLRG